MVCISGMGLGMQMRVGEAVNLAIYEKEVRRMGTCLYTQPKPTASYSLLNTSMFVSTRPSGSMA